jgi:MarR family transcriptional regulator, organic hydroperoxide resistance regulator
LSVSGSRGFDTDWRESVGYLLRDATRMMLRVTAARIAEHGITMTQYFLLRQIWEMDGQLQRDLARQLDVPEPALATLLDALETAGLVVRKRSTQDRRRTHIHVTAAGKHLREPLLEDGKAVLDGMLENCSQRAIDDLRRTLKKIKANLATMEEEMR